MLFSELPVGRQFTTLIAIPGIEEFSNLTKTTTWSFVTEDGKEFLVTDDFSIILVVDVID